VGDHTVVIFDGGAEGVPGFRASVRDWSSRLLGGQAAAVTLAGQEAFNKAFALHAEEPDAVRELFTAEVVRLFLAQPRLGAEAFEDLLVLFAPGKVSAAEWFPLLDRGVTLVRALRAAAGLP
jgi:hypothetical protein